MTLPVPSSSDHGHENSGYSNAFKKQKQEQERKAQLNKTRNQKIVSISQFQNKEQSPAQGLASRIGRKNTKSGSVINAQNSFKQKQQQGISKSEDATSTLDDENETIESENTNDENTPYYDPNINTSPANQDQKNQGISKKQTGENTPDGEQSGQTETPGEKAAQSNKKQEGNKKNGITGQLAKAAYQDHKDKKEKEKKNREGKNSKPPIAGEMPEEYKDKGDEKKNEGKNNSSEKNQQKNRQQEEKKRQSRLLTAIRQARNAKNKASNAVNAVKNFPANVKKKVMEKMQLMTGQLLKMAWTNLITSFGLTYIYIFIHFFMHYLFHSQAFAAPGTEWIPKIPKISGGESNLSKEAAGIANEKIEQVASGGLKIAEWIAFGFVSIIVFFLLLLMIVLISFIVLCNPLISGFSAFNHSCVELSIEILRDMIEL